MPQDTLAVFDTIAAIVYAAVPWLTPGTILDEEPIDPYMGPKPYAVINTPHNTRSHRESLEVGNRPGQPNRYTISYYETAYVSNASRQAEKLRVYQTYDAIAIAMVAVDGSDNDLAGDLAITSVTLETQARGPWIVGPGNQLYIGCLLHLDIEQRYSG